MTNPELSAIFNRHAFDPWHPDNRELDCSVVMDREAFYEAVCEAVAAETKQLVDALRPFANCRVDVEVTNLVAARLVAEFDAAQKGPTDDRPRP